MKTPDDGRTVYKVPSWNMPWLQEKITGLNKQAKKLDVEPIVIRVVGEEMRPMPEGYPGQMYKVFVVKVEGKAPVLNGWEFIATIQHITDEKGERSLVRTVPGKETPDEYRDAVREWCDHCQTRRYRTDTFVVRNETTGDYRRVGRQCLKDFIGHPNPEMYGKWATSLGLLDDLMRAAEHEPAQGVRFERYYGLRDYLTYVAECVSRYGWVSRARSRDTGEMATARVATLEMDKSIQARTLREKAEWVNSATSVKLADDALEWARETLAAKEDKTEYEHNLTVATAGEAIGPREFGIAASLIYVYQREMERSLRDSSSQSDSKHFGTVGERSEFTLKLVEKRDVTYGSTHGYGRETEEGRLLKFEDASGNIATWFTSGKPASRFLVGETYTVKATVKRHDSYRGMAQTILTRCAIKRGTQ